MMKKSGKVSDNAFNHHNRAQLKGVHWEKTYA